jgi:hypothetical protein
VKVGELLRPVGKCTDTAERRPDFTLFFLIPLTADPGVEREAIGLGDPLLSGIRSVQRADGADHQRFTSLLWADGYAVGDGAAQDLWHGIGILSGVEVQLGALAVLFQQALALEAAADALADQLNQVLQFALVRRLDALESGWPVVAVHIDAIKEQDVKMYID